MATLKEELTRVLTAAPQLDGQSWTACYDLDRNFAAFSGHFPEYPLLPAFAQVEAAGCALEKALGKKLALSRIGNAKFIGQVRPESRLRVECSPLDSPRGGSGWDCRVSSASFSTLAASGGDWQPAAQFRIYFAGQD